ncbi:MAG: helix-turn-helix domain-containing protein [Salinivirgaceae bacterium]|nr:helix-turn-helix domain-containing protein [Salinivirgaceae bacterium]
MREENNSEILSIKNMLCQCCKLFLSEKLEELGLVVKKISLGKVEVVHPKKRVSYDRIDAMLKKYGFELTHNREEKIVDEIKIAVIELIHHLNNADSIVRKSDYIVEKLGLSYQYLSKIFSEHKNQTIEKYIISQKIERIKHLIDINELTLSEIAYLMDYSSVQYLSNQFKNITRMTVSQYKDSDRSSKIPIDQL